MNVSIIKNRVIDFNKALSEIEENRKLWNEGIRDMLSNDLVEIKNTLNLPSVRIEVDEVNQNLQAVSFIIDPMRSGITCPTEDGRTKSFIKQGCALHFYQLYNGKIEIVMSYPFIEEIIPKQPNMIIGKLDPNELTEAIISKMVETLFAEMTKWERGLI
jgi:hypothetical protein